MVADSEEDIVLTALSPIVKNETIDWEQTVSKYTGHPFRSTPAAMEQVRPEYTFFVATSGGDPPIPFFNDTRRNNAYAVVVPPARLRDDFNRCMEVIRSIVRDRKIVAVDTGGDSLRGLVAGMGDTDVSHLYCGEVDTRDHDSLQLLWTLTSIPVRLCVIGPGCDGESSNDGILNALHDLRENRCDNVQLIREINLDGSFGQRIANSGAWLTPSKGSTLDNINRGRKEADTSVVVPVVRKGVVVNNVRAQFLVSVLELDVHFPMGR